MCGRRPHGAHFTEARHADDVTPTAGDSSLIVPTTERVYVVLSRRFFSLFLIYGITLR